MKGTISNNTTTPDTVVQAAEALGARIRAARTRRKMRREDLAERSGLSRTAIEAVEAGKLTTGLGTYLRALWAMGLTDPVALIADPGLDRDGLALELNVQTKRVKIGRPGLDNDF